MNWKSLLLPAFIACATLLSSSMFPPLTPYLVLSLPAVLFGAVLGENLAERAAASFLCMLAAACLIGLPLMLLGAYGRTAWLVVWGVLVVLALLLRAAVHRHSLRADIREGAKKANVKDARSTPAMLVICLAAGLPVILAGLSNTYMEALHGPFWSVHELGRHVAATGRFPWLDAMDVGHHNDHLFYNPGAALVSASSYLWTRGVLIGETSVNLLPALAIAGSLAAFVSLGLEICGSAVLGALAFVVFYSLSGVFLPCAGLSTDLLLPMCVCMQFLGFGKLLHRPDRRAIAILLLALVMGGMVRPYAGPQFVLAAVVFFAAGRLLLPANAVEDAKQALAYLRHPRVLAVTIAALLLMVGWNAALFVKYGNPVYPHASNLFGAPAGLTPEQETAVRFSLGLNPGSAPGMGRLERFLLIFGLHSRVFGAGPGLVHRLLWGAALLSPVWLALAVLTWVRAFRKRQARADHALLLLYAVISCGWFLWPRTRDITVRLMLPLAVALVWPATEGLAAVFHVVVRRFSPGYRNQGAVAAKRLLWRSSIAALLAAFIASPYVVRSRSVVKAIGRDGLIPSRDSFARLMPDKYCLYRRLCDAPGFPDNLLLASYCEPGGYVFFLPRKKPYWRYRSYQSPRLHALHMAATEEEVMRELDALGVEYVLAMFQDYDVCREFLPRLRARGAPEHFLVMLFGGSDRFERIIDNSQDPVGTAELHILVRVLSAPPQQAEKNP